MRDQDRALVSQGTIYRCFQTLAPVAAVRMQAIAIGAFEHQHIGALRWLERTQQGVLRRADIAREHHTGAARLRRGTDVALDVR